MTPIVLIDTLVKFIESVVVNFELQSNVSGIQKAPQVVSGYLKEKKPNAKQDPPDVPYVIVRFLEDDDTEAEDIARVRIIVCTYSEDTQDGWRDTINVITRIKEALLELRFIGGPFKIERPIKTELPEEQPYPEWVGWMTIHVSIPQVQEEGGYLKDVFR